MKIYLYGYRGPKKIPPCCWQNCYFSPSRSGFKDQHLAGLDGVCSGLHVYQVTNFKDTRPYTASDESKGANDTATLSFCHSLLPGDGSSFFSYNWDFSFLYQQHFWRIWSLSLNLLNGSQHFSRGSSLVCELLGVVHRWHCWLMLQSVASSAQEEEGKIAT